jgi:Ser/Thr protein kinase RdoA (MazF antagonist)
LRIHREGYHSRNAIASELAWLMDLRNMDPRPVRGLEGELIPAVCGRNVVLFDWETGAEPVIHQALEKPFEVLGEVTARMHLHAQAWKRPEGFQRFIWDFETSLGEHKPHCEKWRDGMGVDAAHAEIFGRTVALIGKCLSAYGKSENRLA